MSRAAWLASGLLFAAAAVRADGGRVLRRADAGPFAVTVFTAAGPVSAGPVDVSVLVQDRASGEALLDAAVAVTLTPPGGAPVLRAEALPGRNRLLREAILALPEPGDWRLDVQVRRGGASGTVSALLSVEPPASRVAAIWPFLAAPPLAVALFALRRKFRRRPRFPSPAAR